MNNSLIIDRKKLFEQVAEHLESQILDGKLKPGDILPPERDLQLSFGVGRPAIREALISLQKSGLIEISNGLRARVSRPTARHIFTGMAPAVRQMIASETGQRQFQDARMMFEVALTREAAARATDADVARLEVALEANRAAIGQTAAFVETDIAFHLELTRIVDNPIFIALHGQILSWLKEQRIVSLAAEGQDRTAFAAHRAIFEAIRARDPDQSERAMRAHLSQLTDTYWRQRGRVEE